MALQLASADPRTTPIPGIAPGAMTQPAITPIVAARPPMAPGAAAPALMSPIKRPPEPAPRKPKWLEGVGQVAKRLAAQAEAELQAAMPQQPQGGITPISAAGRPPQPGIAQEEPPEAIKARAARGLVKRSPTLTAAVQSGADTFEKLSGMTTEEAYVGLEEAHKDEDLPKDLDREEKGMLLMQLGFGIMSGGPGLVQALGQAGLQTMGTWHDLRARKRAEGREAKKDRVDLAEKKLDVVSRREEQEAANASRVAAAEAKANAPMKLRPGDVVKDPQSGETLYSIPAAPGKAPAEPVAIREMVAMGYDPKNPEDVQAYYAGKNAGTGAAARPQTMIAKIEADFNNGRITQEQRQQALAKATAVAGGEKPLREERVAQYYARTLGISEADAVKFAKASADSQLNPDKMVFDLTKTLLSSPFYANDPDKAMREAQSLVAALQQGPEAAAEAVKKLPEKKRKGWLEAIGSMLPWSDDSQTAEAAEPAPAAAAGPSVTQTMPPTPGGPRPDAPVDELIDYYTGGGR